MNMQKYSISRVNSYDADMLIARFILAANSENNTILIKRHTNSWKSHFSDFFLMLCSKLKCLVKTSS